MLKPVRQAAGLGSPPEHFSTNASESVNAVLKAKVDYKHSELPAFVRKIEELVKDQKTEFEQAIIKLWEVLDTVSIPVIGNSRGHMVYYGREYKESTFEQIASNAT